MESKKRVVVFGIFDGVHDGHRDLFRQARELGDELVVIVGRDEVAEKLKGRRPRYSEAERVAMLKQEPLVDDAILGDSEFSSYASIQKLHPDLICLGYDQQELGEDLKQWIQRKNESISLVFLKPYKPEVLHNSLSKN